MKLLVRQWKVLACSGAMFFTTLKSARLWRCYIWSTFKCNFLQENWASSLWCSTWAAALEILIHSLLFLAGLSTLRICFSACHKLDPKFRNSTSHLSFSNSLLNFIRLSENKIFIIQDQVSSKLLTRLRIAFSHLREHKFRYNLDINPLCLYSINP